MGVIIVTDDPDFIEFLDQFVDPDLDYSDPSYDDYWCVSITSYLCPGCNDLISHAQVGNHLIVIWEEKDDDAILEVARTLKEVGMDPRIINYKRDDGPCIEFYEACKRGLIDIDAH